MGRKRQQLAVEIIGWIYVAVGVLGFAYHLREVSAYRLFIGEDVVLAELVSVVAVVCGVYLLRGAYWARWLAVGWMAFHVIVSFFHSLHGLVTHLLLLLLLAYFLLRPTKRR